MEDDIADDTVHHIHYRVFFLLFHAHNSKVSIKQMCVGGVVMA